MGQISAEKVEFPRIDRAGKLTKSEYQFALERAAASKNWTIKQAAQASTVLKELYINAVEYTGNKPQVALQVENRGSQAYLTLSVDDVGVGILKHFLGSLPGQFYIHCAPETVLSKLLLTKLSSKSSPSAGDGFLNVLRAAECMRAEVELRTQVYSWAIDFAVDYYKLPDVSELSAPYNGTSWKISWPMDHPED